MKKICILLCLTLIASNIFSFEKNKHQDFENKIKIYAPVAQQILIDKNNYIRYSPVNILDDNSDTVYAVTFDEIDNKKPLLEIYFSEPAVFDKISIKAGYFDDRYFEKNNRIKNLQLKIYNCKNLDAEKNVLLLDEMKEQNIYAENKIIATKIEIYAKSVYQGSKWNDLVISDLDFYLEGQKLPVTFDIGKCTSCNVYRKYEYDDLSRITHEYVAFGKSGGKDTYYKYENNKIATATSWDGEKLKDSDFVEIETVVKDGDKNVEFIYANNLLVVKKYSNKNKFYINQYLYNQNCIYAEIRICQNANFDEKYTKYKYNSNGQITEISDYGDATIYKNRYE